MKTLLFLLPILLFVSCKQLNEKTAAQLASALANKECSKLFKQEPFSPENYPAIFNNNTWSWGKFDPAGINGYSAEVSFDQNGKNQKVSVRLSTDNVDQPTQMELHMKDMEK